MLRKRYVILLGIAAVLAFSLSLQPIVSGAEERQEDVLETLPQYDRVWNTPPSQPIEFESEGVPTELQVPLDINNLTLNDYNRVIGAAREGMRLVIGEMSEEEAALFDQKWTALAYYPTDEIIGYLNKLNPLISEFLITQSAIQNVAEDFDAAWLEATTAVGYGNERGAREAFALAEQHKALLQSLNKRMAVIVKKVEALGNPPDPIAARKAAKKKHKDAVKTVKKLLKKPIPHVAVDLKPEGKLIISPSVNIIEGGSLVTLTVELPGSIAEKTKRVRLNAGFTVDYVDVKPGETIIQNISYFPYGVSQPGPIEIYAQAENEKGSSIAWGRIHVPYISLEFAEIDFPRPFVGSQVSQYNTGQPIDRILMNAKGFDGEYSYAEVGIKLETSRSGFDRILHDMKLWDASTDAYGREDVDIGNFSGEIMFTSSNACVNGKGYLIQKDVPKDRQGPLNYVEISFRIGVSPCGTEKIPVTRGLLNSVITTIKKVRIKPQEASDIAVASQEESEEEESVEDKQERITFHESNVAILEKNLQREQNELGKEQDDERRKALEFRVLTLKADIQAEKDLIESIKTKTIVHTRTEYDNYTQAQFVANIKANSLRMEAAQRRRAELQRLAGLLPPGEDDKAREFISQHLSHEVVAKGDMEKVQEVNDVLMKKVEGYVDLMKASQELEEAEKALMVLNGVQMAGNIAVFYIGGQYGAAAYGGLTGYITGGPVESFRGAAFWCSTAGYAAVEALDGYYKGGYMTEAGVGGAIEKATEAVLIAKAFEFGLTKLGTAAGVLKRPATREELKRRLADFRRAEALKNAPKFSFVQYRQEMEQGKKLVYEYANIEQRLIAAKAANMPKEELGKLHTMAREKAGQINASFHAKNYLKNGGGEIERLASKRINDIYKSVDKQFRKNLIRKGWDTKSLKFREFRNAKNRGTIGMDSDYGVVENKMNQYVKKGKKTNVYELQKDGHDAYKKAYEEVTGQSYEKSFQEFTTRANNESFRDLGVLEDLRNPENVAILKKIWGEQTARTIEYKGLNMLNDPKLNPHISNIERYMEASRGMGKEIESKLVPFLQNAKPVPGLDANRIRETEKHFVELKKIIDDMTSYKIDPITASRKIRLHTGGKDIPEVLDQMRNITESLFKFGGVGK